MLAEAQDGRRGGRGWGGTQQKLKGCPRARGRKGTLTQPGWQHLGPSTGGKEPPAGAFHPPGQPGALERGERDQNPTGTAWHLGLAGVAAPGTGPPVPAVLPAVWTNPCLMTVLPGNPGPRAPCRYHLCSRLPTTPTPQQPQGPAPPLPPPLACLQPRPPACQVGDLTGQAAAAGDLGRFLVQELRGRERGRKGGKEGGRRKGEGGRKEGPAPADDGAQRCVQREGRGWDAGLERATAREEERAAGRLDRKDCGAGGQRRANSAFAAGLCCSLYLWNFCSQHCVPGRQELCLPGA